MTLTIPAELDQAITQRATRSGVSREEAAVDALRQGLLAEQASQPPRSGEDDCTARLRGSDRRPAFRTQIRT